MVDSHRRDMQRALGRIAAITLSFCCVCVMCLSVLLPVTPAQWLRASCMLQPDGGSEKWMYYGQLIGGEPALDAFKRGITCMLKQKQIIHDKMAASRQRAITNAFTLGEHEDDAALAQQLVAVDKQISSGYTSMAELYVTDCWSVIAPGASSASRHAELQRGGLVRSPRTLAAEKRG